MKQNAILSHTEFPKKAISLTAYRACFIALILAKSPKSLDEILAEFSKNKLLSKSCHKDTITNAINSLRIAGFEIEKPKPTNNYKYTLISHPFKFKISQEQANLLHLIRNSLSYQSNYEIIFKLNTIYDKILALSDCEKCIDTIECSNYFKNINLDLLNKILKFCNQKADARIIYNSPVNGKEELQIKTEKVVFENNRLYLWLYSYKYQMPAYFRVDKIYEIKPENLNTVLNIDIKLTNYVKYELSGNAAKKFMPKDDEIIIEKQLDKIIVQANVINRFNFFQHIISFGDNCKIVEPEYIKQDFACHLKSIMEVYTGEKS